MVSRTWLNPEAANDLKKALFCLPFRVVTSIFECRTPPESDGGAPITHYVIEMKEKNMGHWIEGKTLTVKEVQVEIQCCKFTFRILPNVNYTYLKEMGGLIRGKQDGLIEGCEYQFRVRAVNKGGPSKPSPPSLPMIAKTRFRKIYILNLTLILFNIFS